MKVSTTRLCQMMRARNRLNDLGDVVLGWWNLPGGGVETRYLYPQGSAKNAKRIRVRNKLNARILAVR